MTVGLVPTMGALHAGHRALLRRARAECDEVVMSLFVNPAQFGPDEDFDRYPRDAGRDRAVAAEAGVDRVFTPPSRRCTRTASRPTSSRRAGNDRRGRPPPRPLPGVATVVVKLFDLLRPAVAYFGQKDAQQLAVIRRMTNDLGAGVEIRAVETVREDDGLALSTRNAYLSPQERRRAPSLHRALAARDPGLVEGDVDYLAVVDADTFTEVQPGPGALVIGAARFGSTRLIDDAPGWRGS